MRHQTSRNSADRHGNALGRTAVESVDDTKLMQESTHSLFGSEQQQQIEHVHQYGFTSVPQPPSGQGMLRRAAEAFMSFMGAGRSHGVAVAIGDRRFRLYKLQNGEVALHDDQGQQVHLRRDGIWASVPNSKQVKVQIMDDDTMPQDQNAPGGGQNQPQKMGQVQQAGRNATINLTIDKTQFTLNHPNGAVTFNCASFKVNASGDAKVVAGGTGLLVGNIAILYASGTAYFAAAGDINAYAGGNNLATPLVPWGNPATPPPVTS